MIDRSISSSRIRGIFLAVVIICHVFGRAETSLNIESKIKIDCQNRVFISEVYCTQGQGDAIGLISNNRSIDNPIFVDGGIAQSVAATLVNNDPLDQEYAIQIQRFWITREFPDDRCSTMRLDSRILFFGVKRGDKSEEKYSHVLTYEKSFTRSLSQNSEELLEIVEQALNHAIDSLLDAKYSSGQDLPMFLKTSSIENVFDKDGLNIDHLSKLTGVTGVIDTYENLLKLKIHTNFKVSKKANMGADAYTVKIKGVPSDYNNWGVVIDGVIYKKCPWGYQELKGPEELTTVIAPKGDDAAISIGIMFGVVGVALSYLIDSALDKRNGTIGKTPFVYGCIHELNIRTGELHYVVNPPFKDLGTKYVFVNSSFSISDSISLECASTELSLKNREYTRISIQPSIKGGHRTLRISDGISSKEIELDYTSNETFYYLIISKKNEIKLHLLTADDFENRNKTRVDWKVN